MLCLYAVRLMDRCFSALRHPPVGGPSVLTDHRRRGPVGCSCMAVHPSLFDALLCIDRGTGVVAEMPFGGQKTTW
ncbi:hypothetical protein U9M48_020512 [Paspalum notatum var. saurae]|uniref:Uncharacterized protein n=1 Tax=Paspalum notatum var. saurae TaxID=547442 RepID=A0AAQ3TF78_PASNO